MRLADTDLLMEVEREICVGGDEAVFGGGKTTRESMLAPNDDPGGGNAHTRPVRRRILPLRASGRGHAPPRPADLRRGPCPRWSCPGRAPT